jgi:hypothetical protein
MIAVTKMQHRLTAMLTRIKAKVAKFKHSNVIQDSHESHPVKGNAQAKRRRFTKRLKFLWSDGLNLN